MESDFKIILNALKKAARALWITSMVILFVIILIYAISDFHNLYEKNGILVIFFPIIAAVMVFLPLIEMKILSKFFSFITNFIKKFFGK